MLHAEKGGGPGTRSHVHHVTDRQKVQNATLKRREWPGDEARYISWELYVKFSEFETIIVDQKHRIIYYNAISTAHQ